jgi:hypothetical protein
VEDVSSWEFDEDLLIFAPNDSAANESVELLAVWRFFLRQWSAVAVLKMFDVRSTYNPPTVSGQVNLEPALAAETAVLDGAWNPKIIALRHLTTPSVVTPHNPRAGDDYGDAAPACNHPAHSILWATSVPHCPYV